MKSARLRGWGTLSLVVAAGLAVGSSVLYQSLYLATRAEDAVAGATEGENLPVSFSFDGEDAGKIKIVDLDLQGKAWEYSLDGGVSWSSGEERDQWIETNAYELSEGEIEQITAETDIIVHFVGEVSGEDPGGEEPGGEEPGDGGETGSGDENGTEGEGDEGVETYSEGDEGVDEGEYYTIDIVTQELPEGLTADDEKNEVVGATEMMEWRIAEDGAWTSYREETPDLTGDVTVKVRMSRTGTKLASEAREFSFTQNVDSGTEPGEGEDPETDPDPGKDPEEGDDKDPDNPDPEKPGEDEKPGEGEGPERPGEDKEPVVNPDPEQPGENEDPEKPGEDKPGDSEKPGNDDKPGDTDKPGNENKPSDNQKPDETENKDDNKPGGNGSGSNNNQGGNGQSTGNNGAVLELPKTGVDERPWVLAAASAAVLVLLGSVLALKDRRRNY